MATGGNQQQVPQLLNFLMDQYSMASIGEAGEAPSQLSAWEEYAGKMDSATRELAAEAIKHFATFCHDFIQEHPPQTVLTLSQGMGFRLAGGFEVCFSAPVFVEDGSMEQAGDIPVTTPRSIRGQQGIAPSTIQPITGMGPDATAKRPQL